MIHLVKKTSLAFIFFFLANASAMDGIDALKYTIKSTIDLPKDCFTQGFIIHDDQFYLSCGKYGESRIIKLDKNGKILKEKTFDEQYFLESIAIIDGKLYALTWKSSKAFVLDPKTLNIESEFNLKGEGWGLATIGSDKNQDILLTNGSSHIDILNHQWQPITSTSLINTEKRPILNLNDMTTLGALQIVNVWKANELILFPYQPNKTIMPLATIDLSPLNHTWSFRYTGITANGVTYDKKTDCLWVTGKKWGKAYALAVDLPKPLEAKAGQSISCSISEKQPYSMKQ